MKDIKEITKHGQDAMLFDCDECNNTVSIDTFDVLLAEGNLHCPICGAGPHHLFIQEEPEDDYTKLERKLAEIDPLLFVNYHDFKPAQVFFNIKDDDTLICDFVSNQIDVTHCFKCLNNRKKIEKLKKLLTDYVNERDKEEGTNEF